MLTSLTPPGEYRRISPSLTEGFPFFVAWDKNLRIVATGPRLSRLCPEAVTGASLDRVFLMRRPRGEISDTFFRRNSGLLYIFESLGHGVVFRGQLLHLDDCACTLMLAVPWLTDSREAVEFGIEARDLGLQPDTIDLLYEEKSEWVANDELQNLNNRLTEQRLILLRQQTETRRLALVAARTDNAVILTGVEGRIEWVNDAFTRLSGWTLAEIAGKKPGSFLQGPETDPDTVDLMRERLSRGEGFRVELLNYDRHGGVYWIAIDCQPVLDERGKLTGFMAVATDISDRVRDDRRRGVQYLVSIELANADTAKEGSLSVVRTLCQRLSWSAGCVWLKGAAAAPGASGGFIYAAGWHETGEGGDAFLAASESAQPENVETPEDSDWLNRWVADLSCENAYPRAAAAVECGLQTALAMPFYGGGEIQGVLELFNVSGEEPDETVLQALDGICNQLGQFIVRKNAETELIRARDAAEAANRAKSDFLATMSHEIRTPMNGVLGFAQLLQQSSLLPQQADFVSAIRTSAESLLMVINDVLDFSKIESGKMELERRALSINACVEEAMETVSSAAAEKRLDFVARIDPSVPDSVTGDVLRLRQILVNLLGNAIKFTPAGEVVMEVTAGRATAEGVPVTFTVRDTGIGVAPERLAHLFQPFHQAGTSTSRRYGGSGLGLAICRRLVDLMNGTISATSQPGAGSQFTFTIPLPPAPAPQAAINLAPHPALSGRRVLVIDHHGISRHVVAGLLSRWGMDARSAGSPDEAAEPMAGWKPQVLLLDAAYSSAADVAFARRLVEQGAALFLMSRPGDCLSVREVFGNLLSGTLFKPLKVSPLFNSLLAQSGPGAQASKAAPARSVSPVSAGARPPQLLLVEDNPINRKLALAALGQIGCTADVATDGFEAVKAATATRYDAILMDVQMPGMDGLEATAAIRRWEQSTGAPRTHIIALTANALTGDRAVCLNSGMDDYLPKPIRLEALRTALQTAFDASAEAAEETAELSGDSAAWLALRQLAEDLSPEDASSLASDFLTDLPGQTKAIASTMETGRLDDLRRMAHTLKGTASIFSLHNLRAASDEIETAAGDGDVPAARAGLNKLHHAALSAETELRAALSALSSHSVLLPMT